MKVVVIGYNPSFGPMSYGSVSVWAAHGWERNGHDVTMVDRKDMAAMPKQADVFFFVDVSEDYSAQIPADLQGLKVFWAMDVQMPGGTERSINIARKMDYTFCTNYEYGVKILEKFGIESSWVTYGYDHILQSEVLATKQSQFRYDVCMIGHANSPERQQLWNLLRDKYGDRAFVGTVSTREEYVTAKATSRFMISQPTEPFNTIINLRVFNALACGKLLLCKRPTVGEHTMLGLVEGKSVVYWDGFDELVKKIDYYLEHEEEAEAIAANGRLLGDKYLMPNQVRFIEQTLYSKFYERLKAL